LSTSSAILSSSSPGLNPMLTARTGRPVLGGACSCWPASVSPPVKRPAPSTVTKDPTATAEFLMKSLLSIAVPSFLTAA
jgi:hypothetical protein